MMLLLQLNNPLRFVDFLRRKLYEYPELSENLQTGFYQSDLHAASMVSAHNLDLETKSSLFV